jgi:hypothetical protein
LYSYLIAGIYHTVVRTTVLNALECRTNDYFGRKMIFRGY